jgi:YesN/AraC family two-component response regulator
MRIVIADDSSLWRERIRSTLVTIAGISEIYEARNGAEALGLIIEKEPDIAILDIRMPEMNGLELLLKIRELRLKGKTKVKIKIWMLTSYPYPQYKKRCMEEGADYFLSKTEDFNEENILKILAHE